MLQLAITHYARGAACPMAIITRPPDDAMRRQLLSRGGKIWIIGGDAKNLLPESTFLEGQYFPFIAQVSAVRIAQRDPPR